MKTRTFCWTCSSLILGSLCLLLCASLLTIPSKVFGKEEKPIRIGASFVLTGKWGNYGIDCKKGVEIAVEEINREGVLGRKLEVMIEDSAADKSVGIALFRKFAANPEVPLFLSIITPELAAGAPLAKEIGIPFISIGSVASGLPLNEWTFRVNLPVITAVPILIKGLKEKRGVRKFVQIYDMATEYPVSEAKLLEKLIKEDKDLELVSVESFKTGDRDFSAQLAKIRRTSHDVLWISGTTDEAGLIMKQAREVGIKSVFTGTTAFSDPTTFNISGGAMAGSIVSSQFSSADPRPIVQRFVENYEKKEKKSPPLLAVLGYDCMLIASDAIKRAGKLERKAVRDALSSTNGLEGLCGKYTYKGQPDNQTPGFKLYIVTEQNQYKPF